MRLRGTGRFWATSAFLSVVAVFLSPGWVAADWTYEEDFSSDKAKTDTYYHSIFWPQGAYPQSEEPYLYFQGEGFQRELGFEDYHSVGASLIYRFPIGTPPQRAMSGSLYFDLRKTYSTSTGYLLYQLSEDGVNWTEPQQVFPPNQHIWMQSVRGTCYVTFLGTGVLIDNLSVELFENPTTIHVGPQGYSTIQRAIDVARDGDVIEVASGTYDGDGNWDIDFRNKFITVRSAAGPTQTIIDCQGSHRGFYFNAGEGPDSVLRGFTIKNGLVTGSEIPSDSANWNPSSTHPIGGGIYCEKSDPMIIDCIIEDCTAEVGGGIGCVEASPTIIDCVIKDCRAGGQGTSGSGGFGGGIGVIRNSVVEMIDCEIKGNMGYHNSLGGGVYCWQSGIQLTGCTISSNSATGTIKGGGLYCGGSGSNLILTNCIVSKNTADTGGGVFVGSAPESSSENIYELVTIVNCTIANNNLSGSYSPSKGEGIHSVSSDISVRNSILWGYDGEAVILQNSSMSRPVQYSNVEGGYTGQGNKDTDPFFNSVGTDDYHLKSTLGRYDPARDQWIKDSYHSPCIDAGDPQNPVGVEPLTNGKRINMGAYGGTVEASKGEGARIFHVDNSSGSDWGNKGLSRSDAFATIQTAVDEAHNGDYIMVWPGTYNGKVNLKGKLVTIQSAGDAAVITAPNDYAFSFYTAENSNCVLRNFIITGCEAAIWCNGSLPTLANLTIVNNVYGIMGQGGADPDIVNCILWDNDNGDLYHCEANYSCISREDQATRGMNNFSEDPLFGNPTQGDYHLMSRHGRYSAGKWVYDQETSPCIDAGDPDMDIGREQKPHGRYINVGAYGGTPFASLSGN